VRQCLGDIFGPFAAIAVERVPEGVSTHVYRVVRGAEHAYLRVLPEMGATFAPEVRAHQLALAVGARVPEIVHYEPRNEVLGASIMLTTEITGQPVHPHLPRDFVRTVVAAAGRDLARMNAIPVDGFGWVRRDMQAVPGRLTAEQPTAHAFMLAEFDVYVAALSAAGFDEHEIHLLAEVARRGAHWLDDDRAYLAHGDFDTSHIYADESGYSGIIDFGEIRGAPRIYDLAHHHMHDGERLPYATLPFLLEGYARESELPDDCAQHIAYLSLLIALRALARGVVRSPESQIVQTARRAIHRDLHALADWLP